VTFDEHNLLPNAGLIAPGMLAQCLGIADLVEHHVHMDPHRPGAANPAVKDQTDQPWRAVNGSGQRGSGVSMGPSRLVLINAVRRAEAA
jgi:hypothetical protein